MDRDGDSPSAEQEIVDEKSGLQVSRVQGRKQIQDCGIARDDCRYYHITRMRTISLKIPDELLADLERAAKARRVTKSVLVRESLETALRPRPRRGAASCFDLAGDLAGSVKGLPRDLAHNPKYLDGFGE